MNSPLSIDPHYARQLIRSLEEESALPVTQVPVTGTDLPGLGPVLSALNACTLSLTERAQEQAKTIDILLDSSLHALNDMEYSDEALAHELDRT